MPFRGGCSRGSVLVGAPACCAFWRVCARTRALSRRGSWLFVWVRGLGCGRRWGFPRSGAALCVWAGGQALAGGPLCLPRPPRFSLRGWASLPSPRLSGPSPFPPAAFPLVLGLLVFVCLCVSPSLVLLGLPLRCASSLSASSYTRAREGTRRCMSLASTLVVRLQSPREEEGEEEERESSRVSPKCSRPPPKSRPLEKQRA